MLECWNKNPTKRPDFHTLTSLLDSTLESISGYVQVQMNLAPVESEEVDYDYTNTLSEMDKEQCAYFAPLQKTD